MQESRSRLPKHWNSMANNRRHDWMEWNEGREAAKHPQEAAQLAEHEREEEHPITQDISRRAGEATQEERKLEEAEQRAHRGAYERSARQCPCRTDNTDSPAAHGQHAIDSGTTSDDHTRQHKHRLEACHGRGDNNGSRRGEVNNPGAAITPIFPARHAEALARTKHAIHESLVKGSKRRLRRP